MTKTEQVKADDGLKFSDIDRLILNMDFIVASLQVASDHDSEVFDATPIFSEALTRAIATKKLIEKMRPEREVVAW